MKKNVFVFTAIIILIILFICFTQTFLKQSESTDSSQINGNMSQNNENIGIINSSKEDVPNDLSLYKEIDFSSEKINGRLEKFTSAKKDSEGLMLWDDSNTFFVQVVLGEEKYVLYDKQLVQLGQPKVSVFFDDENVLHIILTDVGTAQYNIYDFIYDYENKCFIKYMLSENLPINYFGEI